MNPLEFEFEQHKLNSEQLKGKTPLSPIERLVHALIDLIYEEILLYHFPERVKWYKEQLKKGASLIQDVLTNEHAYLVSHPTATPSFLNAAGCI